MENIKCPYPEQIHKLCCGCVIYLFIYGKFYYFFQIPYKEDWEAEKQLVYYPVHITPGYETSSDVKKVQSDVSFCSATINFSNEFTLQKLSTTQFFYN